jgi:hypothetical protein
VFSPHSTLDTEFSAYPATSASGAGLQTIPATTALDFLQRFGLGGDVGSAHIDSWGAFEDRTTLIGVARLMKETPTRYRVDMAVAPERRRLGIGGELLDIVIHTASAGGGRTLMGSYPAGADEPRCLLASTGLLWARRVRNHSADVVVLLPQDVATAKGAPR